MLPLFVLCSEMPDLEVQVGLVAVRLLGCPLDAAEHAAALEAAAAQMPNERPAVPATAAATNGRVLLPAPSFSPAPTAMGASNGMPSGRRLAGHLFVHHTL